MKRRNIVLEFTASWCTYCRDIQPMVTRLEREGYPIQQVDADKNRDLMNRMGVNALPCFVLLVDGKIKKKLINHSGDSFKNSLNDMLAQATAAREESLQQIKTLVAEQGRKRSLDGAEPSDQSRGGSAVNFISEENGGGAFDFNILGFDKKEGGAVVTAPAVRSESNLSANEKPVPFDDAPISTVRIRVSDTRGTNFGTGTIISSAEKKTFILSCGHIFRELKRGDQVEVDVFVKGKTHTLKASLLNFDADQLDLGLLGLSFDYEFPTSPVAALSSLPVSQEAVYSIGCGGGELPTQIDMQVTQLNRYKGPDTIECTTKPEPGRSGGGLFTKEGELVGVCILAQPQEERGIYTSLKPIYQFLDHCQLSYLHPATIEAETAIVENDRSEGIPSFDEVATNQAGDESHPFGSMVDTNTSGTVGAPEGSNANELELLQQAMAHSGNAEIICLVRPQNDPNGTPRILLINKATPTLINYLNQNPQPATFPVMHSVPGTNNNMNVGTGSPVAEANSSATGIQTAVRPQDRYLPPLDPNPFTNPPGVNNSPWAQQDLNR